MKLRPFVGLAPLVGFVLCGLVLPGRAEVLFDLDTNDPAFWAPIGLPASFDMGDLALAGASWAFTNSSGLLLPTTESSAYQRSMVWATAPYPPDSPGAAPFTFDVPGGGRIETAFADSEAFAFVGHTFLQFRGDIQTLFGGSGKMNDFLRYTGELNLTGTTYFRFLVRALESDPVEVNGVANTNFGRGSTSDPSEFFFRLIRDDLPADPGYIGAFDTYVAVKYKSRGIGPEGTIITLFEDGAIESRLNNNPPQTQPGVLFGNPLELNAVLLLVGRLNVNPAGNVTSMDLWLNPGSGDSAHPHASLTPNTPFPVSAIKTFDLRSQNTVTQVGLIRFASSWELVVPPLPPVITSPATATARLNAAFTPGYQITATGGPTAFAAAGLPAGLTINPSTGLITGTPTQSGIFEVELTATNIAGAGTATLTLTVEAVPAITLHPVSQSVPLGGSVTFTATASGLPAPGLQWRKDGVNLAGATSGSLTLENVTAADQGAYTFRAQNALGVATSQIATLTVLRPPSITTQPQNQLAAAGGSVTFSVAVDGTPPFTYQWQRDGEPIPGATSATFTLTDLTEEDAAAYSVVVSNEFGSTSSAAATLTVQEQLEAPVITGQPSSLTLQQGASGSFSVAATGLPAPEYQWFKDNEPIPGATASTFALSGVSPADAGGYFVVVSNSEGSVTSSTVFLTVEVPAQAPEILTQPFSQTAFASTTVSFVVEADGSPEPEYQWFFNGEAIDGATDPTLTLENVQQPDQGSYHVVVANAVGQVVSSTVSLTVEPIAFQGVYFGEFGNPLGSFAFYVRPNQTGVFLGHLPAHGLAFADVTVDIDSQGRFAVHHPQAAPDSPLDPGAAASVRIEGQVILNGVRLQLLGLGDPVSSSGQRAPSQGSTTFYQGFYEAPVIDSVDGELYLIASADGRVFFLSIDFFAISGGIGSMNTVGAFSAGPPDQPLVSGILDPDNGLIDGVLTSQDGRSFLFLGVQEGQPGHERLINISTRGRVADGNRVLIAGFVVQGTVPKPVVIRALGPTLAGSLGQGALAQQVLADPRLRIHDGDGQVIAENSSWGAARNIQELLTALSRFNLSFISPHSRDAAAFLTLPPGPYTAVVSGAGPTSGLALVEVYDLSEPASSGASRLINISTRGHVGLAENTLIAGFVIEGNVPKRILVRGLGPALTGPIPAAQVLHDPEIRLFRRGTPIPQAVNRRWQDNPGLGALEQAAARVGLPPLPAGSRDAAVVIILEPGVYTAHLRSADGGSGIGLIEVYEIPD
ncbi:MAG: hypothetical protein EA425_01485 [Puniceicoccaceae bacterium]|nr:MAG: hypothetical protein EA425_01485 [Puniceicoccaceae bacterium]